MKRLKTTALGLIAGLDMKSSLARAMLPKNWLRTGLAATLLTISGFAASTPFTYAAVETFAGDSTDGATVMSSASAPVFAERGTAPAAYGKARAQFGSNGFAFQSGAGGGSMWSDGFLVTGGSGSGLINVSVNIHGSVVGTEADMSYTLFASENPFDVQTILDSFDLDDQNPQVAGAVPILHTEVNNGLGSSNITLVGAIPFTYGQQFYLASVFGGDVCATTNQNQQPCSGGSEDFFNSANFGITGPAGATLVAQSGTTYATAVPEPATWLLLFTGSISALAVSRRRTNT